MKNFLSRFILVFVVLGISFLSPNIGHASVNLPWSSSLLNCADWDQTLGLSASIVNCDGLQGFGGWMPTGYPESITLAANFPSGGGGKGIRHWLGDGHNMNSGSMEVRFNTPQKELWIRFYTRYQQGFRWNPLSGQKLLYLFPQTGNGTDPLLDGANGTSIENYYAATYNYSDPTSKGWDYMMAKGATDPTTGHKLGDGQFHCIEIHLKVDTNGADGIGQWWIDGVLVYNHTNINYGNGAHPGWIYIVFADNQGDPGNAAGPIALPNAYQDIDDIVINNTGYIGPIPGTVNTSGVPTPPSNLAVK